MHRMTAMIIKILACKLDVQTGAIHPDTIDEEHFENKGVVRAGGEKLSGPELCKRIYNTTFERGITTSNSHANPIIVSKAFYFNKGGLNGCDSLFHVRVRSYAISENKR